MLPSHVPAGHFRSRRGSGFSSSSSDGSSARWNAQANAAVTASRPVSFVSAGASGNFVAQHGAAEGGEGGTGGGGAAAPPAAAHPGHTGSCSCRYHYHQYIRHQGGDRMAAPTMMEASRFHPSGEAAMSRAFNAGLGLRDYSGNDHRHHNYASPHYAPYHHGAAPAATCLYDSTSLRRRAGETTGNDGGRRPNGEQQQPRGSGQPASPCQPWQSHSRHDPVNSRYDVCDSVRVSAAAPGQPMMGGGGIEGRGEEVGAGEGMCLSPSLQATAAAAAPRNQTGECNNLQHGRVTNRGGGGGEEGMNRDGGGGGGGNGFSRLSGVPARTAAAIAPGTYAGPSSVPNEYTRRQQQCHHCSSSSAAPDKAKRKQSRAAANRGGTLNSGKYPKRGVRMNRLLESVILTPPSRIHLIRVHPSFSFTCIVALFVALLV
eukprot:GHVU01158813.1.p1 GENE.GHVU01158813.1~~GHVU01158813.1.p1  ORF type:complete len:430 (+),score=65.67 GHVU01158813.1:367-1656(+)